MEHDPDLMLERLRLASEEAIREQRLSVNDARLLISHVASSLNRPLISRPDPMHIRLQERLQSLKLLAGLASFLKNPGSLDSVFAVGNSVKDGPSSAIR